MRAPVRDAATERLQLKALAFQRLGRCLSAAPGTGAAGAGLDELAAAIDCLELLGWNAAARAAGRALAAYEAAPEDARTQASRLLDRSLPPPYETTYTAGGSVNVLADIAGFYRAFGMAVEGEKADHAAAEVEFVGYLAAKEAHALDNGEDDHAAVCREARALFLREHAGAWLPLLAARIAEVSPGVVFEELVGAVQEAFIADARDLAVRLPKPTPYSADALMPGPPASAERPFCEPPEDASAEGESGPDW